MVVANPSLSMPLLSNLDLEVGKNEVVERVFISEQFMAVAIEDSGEIIR